ncbi:hypothetical protein NXS19_001380 [Fusarium pseudograminearum]|uniref:Uncharacterized protein n=1 Tax=Fusarium pseudograminearum (strain CS3096) TaxID=1028729 RepID=K3VB97_FUSPC|nr:hypothetical protein FPSE_09072 [Fusarium pseudograminearum CS3096]EKJ70779.1 hypothetical protein FPSE_09072 [Fusarium pseudograminearum CS3096]UZP33564.1 hypothetical protein NXS19_001380 [Fusarium pseudograminearum]
MCLYARVVFVCAHERWGLCVKKCQIAEDFQANKTDQDCLVKSPHVPTSRKLQRKCNRCTAMEDKFGQAKKSIEDVRLALKKISEEKAKKEIEEGSKTRPAVGVDCGHELEVISEEDEETGEESEMGDGSSSASGSCAC